MEKNKKILLGGIIVAVVAGAVLFCYLDKNQLPMMIPFLEPTKTTEPASNGKIPSPSLQYLDLSPEAIANWSVCRNEKYGYEFKYPKGWLMYATGQVEPDNANGDYIPWVPLCNKLIISISQDQIINSGFSNLGIGISVRDLDVWDAMVNSAKELALREKEEVISKEFVIDGKVAKYQINRFGIDAGIFYKKDKFISLRVSNLKGEKFMDAIVSTFKFFDEVK